MTAWRDPIPGGAFILDAPERIPAIWGAGDQVLMAAGEALYLVGPPGVGKTTLAQRFALARSGITVDLEALGFGVAPEANGKVMYLAADRPQQARRSFRRMVSEHDRELLDYRLVGWAGPPQVDFLDAPSFTAWVQSFGAGTLIIDSAKDMAVGLSEDAIGAAFNITVQTLLAAGVEVLILHHQRKGQSDNRKPRRLEDVYGSAWLTAGAGSVLLMWGDPGDAVVELLHLKQPAGDVGPLTLCIDHDRGQVNVLEELSPRQIVAATGRDGVTVKETAALLFKTSEPSRNEIEKARRKLDALTKGSAPAADKIDGEPVRYVARDQQQSQTVARVTPRVTPHAGSRNGSTPSHADVTDVTQPSPPLLGGHGSGVTVSDEELADAQAERLLARHPDVAGGPA